MVKRKYFDDKLERKFKTYIQFHQNLLSLCEYIENIFSPILLPCLCFGTFYIIFIGFIIIVVSIIFFYMIQNSFCYYVFITLFIRDI